MNPELLLGGSSPDIASVYIIFIYVSNLSLSWGATAVSLSWVPTRPASERFSNTHYSEHLTTSSNPWVKSPKQAQLPRAKRKQPQTRGARGHLSSLPPCTVAGPAPANSHRNQPPADKWCSYTLPFPGPAGRHQTGPQSELKAGRRPVQ